MPDRKHEDDDGYHCVERAIRSEAFSVERIQPEIGEDLSPASPENTSPKYDKGYMGDAR
jgi:hypothetical protein